MNTNSPQLAFTLNNGVVIPALGLGTYLVDDSATAQKTIEEALALGYRHIDTAMIYRNEDAIGLGIKNSGIPREELFITTKLWNSDQRKGTVQEAIDTSLKRLGLDYVDLYLVHWPVAETYVSVWQEMEKLYHHKKARAIGVSNYQQHHLEDLLQKTDTIPAVNQVECYPYFSQQPLVDFCSQHQIRPQAWGPLGMNKSDVLENPVIKTIAQQHDKTAAQIILRWNIQRGIVVIPKTTHPSRLTENFALFDFELSTGQMSQINQLNQNKRLGPSPDNFDF